MDHSSYFQKDEQESFRCTVKVRGQAEPGVLYITNKRVLWMTGGVQPKQLSLEYVQIKSHQFSNQGTSPQALLKLGTDVNPQGEGYIFEFLAVPPSSPWKERDKAKEWIAKFLQLYNKSTAPNKPMQPIAPQTPTPTQPQQVPSTSPPGSAATAKTSAGPMLGANKEATLRAKLLSSNPELKALHQQLVGGKVISDQEFWESRKALVQNEMSKATNQNIGMSSALLTDVRPSSETSNTVQYKITPAIIHQIFIENPEVEKLYKEMVPDKMTEQDFWTKYFEALHFHRDTTSNKKPVSIGQQPTSVDEAFTKLNQQEDKKLQEPILYKRKLKDLNPLVDISADEELPEYGLRKDFSQNPMRLKKSLTVIRKFNKHATLVLENPVIKKEKSVNVEHNTDNGTLHTQQIAEETKLEDLDEEKPQDVAPLNIENHRIYFESRVLTDQTRLNLQDLDHNLQSFKQEVAGWRPDSRPSLVPAALANTILSEITHSTQKYNNTPQGQTMSGEEFTVPEDLKGPLLHYFTKSNELLRHFWAALSGKDYQKLMRMYKHIDELHPEVKNYSVSLRNQNRTPYDYLFSTIVNCLEKAIEAYQSDALFQKYLKGLEQKQAVPV